MWFYNVRPYTRTLLYFLFLAGVSVVDALRVIECDPPVTDGMVAGERVLQDELLATLHALAIAHPAGCLSGFSGQLLPTFLASRFPQLQPHSLALLQRVVDSQQSVSTRILNTLYIYKLLYLI